MLGTAQADTLRAKFAGQRSIAGAVRIRPDLELPHVIAYLQERLQRHVLVDVRFLSNPYFVPELKLKTEYNAQSPVLSVAFDKVGPQVAASTKGGEVNLLSINLSLIEKLENSPKDALEIIRTQPSGRTVGTVARRHAPREVPARKGRHR